MPSLEVLKPGLLTTVQDLGRRGLSFFAIPGAGVMDQNAARIALLLLHLPESHPLIECTSIAPQLKFNDAATVALSGADFNWRLNGDAISPNRVLQVEAGDILRGQYAREGLRGYIAIDGALRIKKIYDSYATYQPAGIGGFAGRALKKGDILEWDKTTMDKDSPVRIPVFPGPEFDYLSDKAKEQLRSITYTVSTESNRMGLRLEGPSLEAEQYQLAHSRPVLPGFVQLPPSGKPIIVLQDGQTTGGYPRVLFLTKNALSRINQVRLGAAVTFALIEHLKALSI